MHYRLYQNDGIGGPVDYSSPIQDGPSTSFATAVVPGDWTYAVRAFDPVSGIEELNFEATRIARDAAAFMWSGTK